MNRRGFLKSLAAAVAGVAAYEADPDKLLWVPGAKTFFLPPAKPVELAPTIISEPEQLGDYIAALTDTELVFEPTGLRLSRELVDDIEVDLTERSYQQAIARGSTFAGIRRVRVFDGRTLLAEHGGNVPDLALLRDKLHAIDAHRAARVVDDALYTRPFLPKRRA